MAWTTQFGPDAFTGTALQDITAYNAVYVEDQSTARIDVNGTACQTQAPVSDCFVRNTTTLANIQAAEFKLVSGLIGTTIRAASNKNCYIGYFNEGLSSRAYRSDAGTLTQLGSSGSAPAANDTCRIEGNGSALTVLINGTSTVSTTDGTYASGNGGFWSNGANKMDDFKLQDDAGTTSIFGLLLMGAGV